MFLSNNVPIPFSPIPIQIHFYFHCVLQDNKLNTIHLFNEFRSDFDQTSIGFKSASRGWLHLRRGRDGRIYNPKRKFDPAVFADGDSPEGATHAMY